MHSWINETLCEVSGPQFCLQDGGTYIEDPSVSPSRSPTNQPTRIPTTSPVLATKRPSAGVSDADITSSGEPPSHSIKRPIKNPDDEGASNDYIIGPSNTTANTSKKNPHRKTSAPSAYIGKTAGRPNYNAATSENTSMESLSSGVSAGVAAAVGVPLLVGAYVGYRIRRHRRARKILSIPVSIEAAEELGIHTGFEVTWVNTKK